MNNWKIKKLRDIAEINPKETLKKGSVCKKISMDKLIPYCRDIDDFELDAFNCGAKFRNGDTIMARITPCLENGKISQINCLNQDEVGFGSTEFIVFRAKEGVDKDFLYYLIISDLVKQPAIKSMVGSSGRQRVQNDVVADLDIKIPELSEQRRIGALLKDLDDKIHINGQINKNLEKQAIAIFRSYFPKINEGNKTIGDYIIPKRGKNLSSQNAKNGIVPVIAGGIAPSIYHNIANTAAPVITISASGANAGYVGLWQVPVWASDSSFIDYSMTINTFFWYVLLKTRQKEIFDSQTGSAQPHIYPQHIAEMPICSIKESDINEYSKLVSPLFKEIAKNSLENKTIENIRNAILLKLMNGELTLSIKKTL